MEFDERKIKPESTRKCLQHQVEEQSDVCDITVKMGQWERKYHRCVLMASPFFGCVLKNDFKEKYTGTIKVSCGTPSSVDDALMFLYGKKPTLNDENIEVMIDLAEFFLIPNLKSACVGWLGKQPIANENCLHWLQLSSKYGFELPKCAEFFESHLHEVLLQETSLTLTFESIYYIFTENKFCYLQMDDRLRFLVRWYAAQPEKRKESTEKLLETIAFDDLTMSCLNEIKCDQVVEQLLHEVNVCFEDMHAKTDVFISKSYDALLCFDLARDTWFKLQSSTHEQLYTEKIADTKADVPELYLTRCNYQGYQLHNVNLETDEIKTYEIVTKTSEAVKTTDNFYFGNSVCVVCKSEQVKTIKSDQTASSLNERMDRMRLMSILGPINEPALFELLHNTSTTRYRQTTVVLIGKIMGEQVEMVPQFSITDCEISSGTVNKNSVIALIPKSRIYVLVYDLVGCTMDKVELKTKYGDEIFPAENGFVIHNNERCITIKRISGPALSNRYGVKEYVLGEKFYREKRYFYCNSTWFRYFRESFDLEFRFQCADHSKIEEAPSPDNVVWKELSLPKGLSANSRSTLGGMMHLIRLPRHLLRCHVDCPHCEAGKQQSTTARTFRYDDDNDYYYDDSDSDEYVVTYGMYDSDDYFSSD